MTTGADESLGVPTGIDRGRTESEEVPAPVAEVVGVVDRGEERYGPLRTPGLGALSSGVSSFVVEDGRIPGGGSMKDRVVRWEGRTNCDPCR